MKTNFKTEIDQLSKGIENIQLARGVEDKSLTLTVLSWNINGSGRAGVAEARKQILESVIS